MVSFKEAREGERKPGKSGGLGDFKGWEIDDGAEVI